MRLEPFILNLSFHLTGKRLLKSSRATIDNLKDAGLILAKRDVRFGPTKSTRPNCVEHGWDGLDKIKTVVKEQNAPFKPQPIGRLHDKLISLGPSTSPMGGNCRGNSARSRQATAVGNFRRYLMGAHRQSRRRHECAVQVRAPLYTGADVAVFKIGRRRGEGDGSVIFIDDRAHPRVR